MRRNLHADRKPQPVVFARERIGVLDRKLAFPREVVPIQTNVGKNRFVKIRHTGIVEITL